MYTYEYLPHVRAMVLYDMHRFAYGPTGGRVSAAYAKQSLARVVSQVPRGKVGRRGGCVVCQVSVAV